MPERPLLVCRVTNFTNRLCFVWRIEISGGGGESPIYTEPQRLTNELKLSFIAVAAGSGGLNALRMV